MNQKVARKVNDILRGSQGSQERINMLDTAKASGKSVSKPEYSSEAPLNSLNRLKRSIRESLDKIEIFSDQISKGSHDESLHELQ